ncbi:MAG: dihydrofolate reductase [Bacillota bacterium]|nr:dihydrofolate reductase [Bacillota bacterium]
MSTLSLPDLKLPAGPRAEDRFRAIAPGERRLLLLASVDRAGGIGRGDALLLPLRQDLRRLRRLTMGDTVVVGRRTLESFPGAKPLAGRPHLVLSGSLAAAGPSAWEGTEICPDLPALLDAIARRSGRIWILGGAQVYRQLLPYCHQAWLTHIDARLPGATHYLDIPQLGWRTVWRSPAYLDRASRLGYHYEISCQEEPHALPR